MEKLPSCRALASELGINPNTVERAYSILEKEKYILNTWNEEYNRVKDQYELVGDYAKKENWYPKEKYYR